MLRLYTDESPGLKVDPMVIMFLSLGFIFSVVALHCEYKPVTLHKHQVGVARWTKLTRATVIAKVTKRFS